MAYTILVVDDSLTARRLNRRCLEKIGFRGATYLEASDGAEAVRVLESNPVDLIVTDLDMPVMTGQELCRKLHGEFCATPVVVLSATAEPEDRASLEADGAAAVLQKPAFPTQFAKVLAQQLELFHSRAGAVG